MDSWITETYNHVFLKAISVWQSLHMDWLKALCVHSAARPPPSSPSSRASSLLPSHRLQRWKVYGSGSSRENQPPSVSNADENSMRSGASQPVRHHTAQAKSLNPNHLRSTTKWKEPSFQACSVVAGFSKPFAHVSILMMKVRKEPMSEVDSPRSARLLPWRYVTTSGSRGCSNIPFKPVWGVMVNYSQMFVFTSTLLPLMTVLKWNTLDKSLLIKRNTCRDPGLQ